MTLQAFHNDKAVQKKYLDRVMAHYKADEIIKGIYWENGKGCAVGCCVHGSDHSRYETELGIPQVLAWLEDCIFEGLSNRKAKEFPVRFLKSVKVGKDLSLVSWKFLHWLQGENLEAAEKQKMPEGVIAAIKQCMDVLLPLTKNEPVDKSAAAVELAASAASAAKSAAWSAWSAAWSAALAAKSAAAESAESAALAAAESAESAAESWEKMADKLIQLIAAA